MSPLPEVQVGNDDPLYNIGVVSRMTGLSMATLRAWERRYDFPEAKRTPGGHRLYSEKDVMRLRWVKDRIEEGLQTAQAIQGLRHQEYSGRVFTQELYPHQAAEVVSPPAGSHLPLYQKRLHEALVHRDLQVADVILGEALASSSPEDLILEVIAPTFANIGQAWEDGRISVATEHFSTNYLRQRLLMWMLNGPPPRSSSPVVMACAPNEWHEGSLLILGALLRRRRWPVAYLGQAVPLPDLASFLQELQPAVAVLVAMTEGPASELIQWTQWMPQVLETGRPVIGYGGRIFTQQPEWRARMNGVYLGDTIKEGMYAIERLLLP